VIDATLRVREHIYRNSHAYTTPSSDEGKENSVNGKNEPTEFVPVSAKHGDKQHGEFDKEGDHKPKLPGIIEIEQRERDQLLERAGLKSLEDIKGTAETSKADHAEGKHGFSKNRDGFVGTCPDCQCETCKNRRYQDGSDDKSVSFQQATQMTPNEAKTRVMSHEMEHVRNEQHDAKEEGRKVVSQSVQIKTAICPECGTTYVSGGTTRTVTKAVTGEFYELFQVGGVSEETEKEVEKTPRNIAV
jgi:hypothetical protein